MSEHLKYLGRRRELEVEKKSLEIRARGLVTNLRDELDPLKSVDEMRPDVVAELTKELDAANKRYKEVLTGLKQIESIIGK